MAQNITLSYGGKLKDFERVIRVNQTLRPNYKKPIQDFHKSFLNSISEPIGDEPLIDKIERANSIAIILGDRRKIKQEVVVLNYVLELFKKKDPSKIALFIASGERSKLTLKDLDVPADLAAKIEFIPHNAFNNDDSIYVGVTSKNNRVKLNKKLLNYDLKIGIDVIRPHLFAGYTGGGQIILPGLAHHETISFNHSMRVKDTSFLGNTRGNPVKEDMNEAAEFVENLFLINIVLTRENEFLGVVSGTAMRILDKGSIIAHSVTAVPAKKTDIVIVSGGEEFTTSLYEAGKLLGPAGLVVNSGGIIILLAQCKNGTGNKVEFIENVYQKSLIHYLPRVHKLFLVSDLPKSEEENSIYEFFPSLEEAQNEALKQLGKDATLTLMHNADYLIPEVG